MDSAIIPAQPGYYLLNVMYTDDGGPSGFEKTPVIAWDVIHGNTHPVGDVHSLGDAIMRPDGSVYIAGERYGNSMEFEDESSALRYFTAQFNRHTNNT